LTNAITGLNDHLHPKLVKAIRQAESIRLAVSFVMESGAKLIAPELKLAADRGATVRLLTGRYLSITEPSALYYLKNQLGDAIDMRFYNGVVQAFHPKAYLFDYGRDAEVFVGSSNLSLSALTDAVEWNYRFTSKEHPDDYRKFSDTFDALFQYCSEPITPEVLKSYSIVWKKPAVVRLADAARAQLAVVYRPSRPEPRGAQIEALYYLKRAREEGAQRGLVVAATGVGKTHIAAFDSLAFRRVLFVAHRQEIAEQAYKVFSEVRPESTLGLYTGERKDLAAGVFIATVQTLSRTEHLELFDPEYFEYVVVDEFHHAAAESYRKVVDYFRPKFLLGLTATPFRMDNKDIFTICDDNVVYEISLKQAIERDLLVPFSFYAVNDPTDYDEVRVSNGAYVIEDLERQLSRIERADLVLKHYFRMAGERTLGFCVSIKHADYMAQYFSAHGVPAVAVHSGQSSTNQGMDRSAAIAALERGSIKVLFAVDVFNEGVDIPSLDTVMFLRPTESYVVFLQQLGRGLRKHPGKHSLTVIDFIGNYRRAHHLPRLLAGENPWLEREAPRHTPTDEEYPEGCTVNFDFRVIELFDELAKRDPLPERLRDTYWRIKTALGRRPTRVDVYEGSDIPIREYLRSGWLRFLDSLGELTDEESAWLSEPAEAFLREVERTSLTKAYKLPTIAAFLRDGTLKPTATLVQIAESMKEFYKSNPLHEKDLTDDSNRGWRNWAIDDFARLARKNPVNYLSKGKFFRYDEINRVMYIEGKVHPSLSPALASHVRDILEFRRIDYFRRRFKD
jgi:superfamily II DNA or RNA helicase/HKD family nuclease